MAESHFVEAYERLVDSLLAKYPLDEAMERAVGGSFNVAGPRMVDVLRRAGIEDGHSIIDLGCGSGRLAKALSQSGIQVDYLGTDIIQRLLDYAATITPDHYVFKMSQTLAVPAEDYSADIICAFSLFTHLLPHETYIYLQDCHRVLKDGGRLAFSFLEFAMPQHWDVFNTAVTHTKLGGSSHLDAFIERNVIQLWAKKIGFEVVSLDPVLPGDAMSELGQSVVILTKLKHFSTPRLDSLNVPVRARSLAMPSDVTPAEVMPDDRGEVE